MWLHGMDGSRCSHMTTACALPRIKSSSNSWSDCCLWSVGTGSISALKYMIVLETSIHIQTCVFSISWIVLFPLLSTFTILFHSLFSLCVYVPILTFKHSRFLQIHVSCRNWKEITMSHPLHGMFQRQNWGEESGVVLIKVLLFCILLWILFSVPVVVKEFPWHLCGFQCEWTK